MSALGELEGGVGGGGVAQQVGQVTIDGREVEVRGGAAAQVGQE